MQTKAGMVMAMVAMVVVVAAGAAGATAPAVSTHVKCADLFCRKASLEVVAWPGGLVAQDTKTKTVGQVCGVAERKAVEATRVFSAYDAATKTVYLGVAGGCVPKAMVFAIDVAAGKNTSMPIPDVVAGAPLGAVVWGGAATVLLQYGPALMGLDTAGGSVAPVVAAMWTASNGYAAVAGVGTANGTHYVTTVTAHAGNEYAFVIVDLAAKSVAFSPFVPTTQQSSVAWTPLFVTAVPGSGFLSLSTSALGSELVFVDVETTNATATDLGFTGFAGLGWSAATRIMDNVPFAFCVDATPGAMLFVGQWTTSGSEGATVWGGIGVPKGTHITDTSGDLSSSIYAAPVVLW